MTRRLTAEPADPQMLVGSQQNLRFTLVVDSSRKAGRECQPDCERHLAVVVALADSEPNLSTWGWRESEFAQTQDPKKAAHGR